MGPASVSWQSLHNIQIWFQGILVLKGSVLLDFRLQVWKQLSKRLRAQNREREAVNMSVELGSFSLKNMYWEVCVDAAGRTPPPPGSQRALGIP